MAESGGYKLSVSTPRPAWILQVSKSEQRKVSMQLLVSLYTVRGVAD